MPSEALQHLNKNPDIIIPGQLNLYRDSAERVIYIYTIDGGLIDEEHRSAIKAIIIHCSVDAIPVHAFLGFSEVELVEFQDQSKVHTIGTAAFKDCFALVEIDLSSVLIISEDAFCNCISLVRLTFGRCLVLIGQCAFYNCSSLVSVVIPSVADIEFSAFRRCWSLETVELPEEVKSIHEYAFAGCRSLTRLVMPLINSSYDDVLQPNVFFGCNRIIQVELRLTCALIPYLGEGINDDIHRITDVFRATPRNKTAAMKEWIISMNDVYYRRIYMHYHSMSVAECIISLIVLNTTSDDDHCVDDKIIRRELTGCGIVKNIAGQVMSYIQLPTSMHIMAHGVEVEYTYDNVMATVHSDSF